MINFLWKYFTKLLRRLVDHKFGLDDDYGGKKCVVLMIRGKNYCGLNRQGLPDGNLR